MRWTGLLPCGAEAPFFYGFGGTLRLRSGQAPEAMPFQSGAQYGISFAARANSFRDGLFSCGHLTSAAKADA